MLVKVNTTKKGRFALVVFSKEGSSWWLIIRSPVELLGITLEDGVCGQKDEDRVQPASSHVYFPAPHPEHCLQLCSVQRQSQLWLLDLPSAFVRIGVNPVEESDDAHCWRVVPGTAGCLRFTSAEDFAVGVLSPLRHLQQTERWSLQWAVSMLGALPCSSVLRWRWSQALLFKKEGGRVT